MHRLHRLEVNGVLFQRLCFRGLLHHEVVTRHAEVVFGLAPEGEATGIEGMEARHRHGTADGKRQLAAVVPEVGEEEAVRLVQVSLLTQFALDRFPPGDVVTRILGLGRELHHTHAGLQQYEPGTRQQQHNPTAHEPREQPWPCGFQSPDIPAKERIQRQEPNQRPVQQHTPAQAGDHEEEQQRHNALAQQQSHRIGGASPRAPTAHQFHNQPEPDPRQQVQHRSSQPFQRAFVQERHHTGITGPTTLEAEARPVVLHVPQQHRQETDKAHDHREVRPRLQQQLALILSHQGQQHHTGGQQHRVVFAGHRPGEAEAHPKPIDQFARRHRHAGSPERKQCEE